MISILPVINPTKGHFQRVGAASTAHSHLSHVIDIFIFIAVLLLVEKTKPSPVSNPTNRKHNNTYYPAFKLVARWKRRQSPVSKKLQVTGTPNILCGLTVKLSARWAPAIRHF